MTIHDFIDEEIKSRSDEIAKMQQSNMSYTNQVNAQMNESRIINDSRVKLATSNTRLTSIVQRKSSTKDIKKIDNEKKSSTPTKNFVIKKEDTAGNRSKPRRDTNLLKPPAKPNKIQLHASFESISKLSQTSYMQTPIHNIDTAKLPSDKKFKSKLSPINHYAPVKLLKIHDNMINISMDSTTKQNKMLIRPKSKDRIMPGDNVRHHSFTRQPSFSKQKSDKGGLSVSFSPITQAKSPLNRDDSREKLSPTFMRLIPKNKDDKMAITVTMPDRK